MNKKIFEVFGILVFVGNTVFAFNPATLARIKAVSEKFKTIGWNAVSADEKIFFRADLSNADLSGLSLSGINLGCANLSGANLTDACLFHTELGGANLTNTNFTKADLRWANFEGAIFDHTILREANLGYASFGPGIELFGKVTKLLNGVDFSRANLAHVNLTCVEGLERSILTGADFDSVILTQAQSSYAREHGAINIPE